MKHPLLLATIAVLAFAGAFQWIPGPLGPVPQAMVHAQSLSQPVRSFYVAHQPLGSSAVGLSQGREISGIPSAADAGDGKLVTAGRQIP